MHFRLDFIIEANTTNPDREHSGSVVVLDSRPRGPGSSLTGVTAL